MSEIQILRSKIDHYRKKVHLNSLIRGSLQFVIVTAVLITLVSLLEHLFWFSSEIRTLLFYTLIVGEAALLWFWVMKPAGKAFHLIKSELSDQLLAEEIGKFFPEVRDKLVNALQLERLSSRDNSLILAGISSHLDMLKPIPFSNGISYRVNLKYVKYAGLIMLSMLLFSFLIPGIYTNSTKRVIDYTSDYQKPMPFKLDVSYKNDFAFQGEPFDIEVSVSGESIPSQIFMVEGNRRVFLNKLDNEHFDYTIDIVQKDIEFQLEAGGFQSKKYQIPMENRAALNAMSITLDFPKHTRKPQETTSQGKLAIPEGTVATWNITAAGTDDAILKVNDSLKYSFQQANNQVFTNQYQFLKSAKYEIHLQNKFGNNREKIQYLVDVIPDEFPQIEANYYLDTILYEYVLVSGEVFDDYGIRSITVSAIEDNKLTHSETIRRNSKQSALSFYHQLSIDSLFDIKEQGKARSLYVSVTDNDAINNYKTTRSESFIIRLPQRQDIEAQMKLKAQETSDGLKKSIKRANSINDKIEQLQERLLNKKSLEWQEEKLLQELLEQRKQIEEEVQKLQEKFDQLSKAEEKFTGKSEEIQEKAEQLQNLMNEVLDEETKKMYEELQRLMEENADVEDLKNQLDQLSGNENNLEKELERALELFKRLKLETELEQAGQKLEELSEDQESLANETKDKGEQNSSGEKQNSEEKSTDELLNEQERLNQKFEDIQEQIENVQQLNQQLKNPEPLQDIGEELEDIEKGMKNAQQMLEQNDFNKGSQQQRQNSQKMKELGEKMSQMMQSMQMEMISEDIDNLRNILDNLVKLSFRQEELINGFYEVKQVDPRFVELSQEQLKLKDDAEIIEDSLIALSQRVVQMSSFITREVALVNDNVDAALTNLRNRDRNKALSNQQFAMASINNLALLLDDLLQQMQNSMASGMSKGKPQNQKGEGLPNLKELQKSLSQQIQQLKQGQKKGRQLSENLAKMAAQQEMLREKLSELKNSLKGQPGGEEAGDAMEKAMKLMEQNEIDLVNRRLTQQLMERQEEIMTRMLDAENAMKEQEFDNDRKGETAEEIDRNIPKAFQEYLLERKKQIELQKTIPIGLNPFYKKEVNDYFRRLSTEN